MRGGGGIRMPPTRVLIAVTEQRERDTGHESRRPKKCEGGRTVTGSRLFEKPTVPTDGVRSECNTRQQGLCGHHFDDSRRLRPTH